MSIILGFLTRNWQALAGLLLIGVFYAYASHQGFKRCATEEQAKQVEQLQRQNADLVRQVAAFNAKEAELQAIVAQAVRDRDKILQENLTLRHEGEALVKTDHTYHDCAVPPSGVQYIQRHY